MDTLLMLLMFSGAKLGAGFAKMFIAQRRERFKKWEAFIKFLSGSLLDYYLYWRGVPVITDKAGAAVAESTETNALLKAKYNDDLLYQAWRTFINKGTELVLEIMRPSEMEEALMESFISMGSGGGFGGGGTTVVQNLAQPTAAQVRNSGGAAQAVILPNGTVLT